MRQRKSSRKVAPPPADVAELIKRISDAPDNELVGVLRPIRVWRYLRGDMHAWVSVTKQFVRILSAFCESYGFGAGSSKQCKLQLNEFTPKDKELILEILRFIRLLMENCTSRKLFQGYEVINDLLLTSDLDVLEATIFVLLRPLQQYLSNMPTSPELSNSIRQRLLALTRGWDTLPLAHIDLVKYVSSVEPLDALEHVPNLQLQFYPTSSINSSGPAPDASPAKSSHLLASQAVMETPTRPTLVSQRSEHRVAGTPLAPKIPPVIVETTMVTVDLESIAKMSGDYIDTLASIADDNQMDIDDQLLAMSKIRVVRFADDLEARRKLLSCRLMALACYVIFSSEDSVQSTILLYEPELVNQVSELLVPGRGVPDSVVASAVLALDSMSRHRPAEVLTTISAHVSHGIIMNLLRSIANKLSSGEDVEHNLVDAIFGFVSNINALPTHGTLLVGAGLMPVLLELLDTKGDRRLQYISRACGLIDSALYNHSQALPAFTNADGLNIMVNKVKAEVKMTVDAPLPEPTELESRDTILSFKTQALKAELRSIYRMLQSTGGAEGFRNVVDTDLPKSIKAIFLNMDKCGERNFVLATNIMATIIHNEPTSLGILQEMNLPQTFYDVLDKYMSGSFEVIYALPNAIGAICLNPAGQQATVDHFGVIKKLISATVALKPESHERDYIAAIGTSLDELARHHPLLRPKVLETVLDILKAAVAEGQDFHPPRSERNEYAVEPAETESSEMDVENGTPPSSPTETTNPPLSKISNILKLLTGVLRNSSMCKDFIKEGGLDLVLSIADLPCVPVRFSTTEAAVTIPAVLRTIGEHDQIQLTERLVAAAKQDLEALPDLWRDDNARANWWALLDENGSAEDNRRFRRAAGFAMRLSFLSEYLAINLGMHRTSTQLIKTLGVSSGSDFVPNLGLLHRVLLQEHSIMKHFNMFNKPPSAPVVDGAIATQASAPDETSEEPSGSDASAVNPAIRVVEAGSEDATDPEKKQPPTRASTVKTLVIRLHAILTKFFKASIRLIFNKRIPESAHKAEASALADCISHIIIGHLTCSAQVPQFALTIDTVALGLSTILLFDERGSEGHLSTTLFIPFDKKGGLTTMLATVRRIVAAMDNLPHDHLQVGESEQTVAQRDATAGCQAGIRIVVAVLNAFSSPRSLIESPQTHVIEAREAAYPPNKRFSPVATFVRIRRDIFPIAQHIWNAPWLPFMPQPILRMAVGTFLDIMAGKNEQPHPTRAVVPDLTSMSSLPPPIPRPQVVADPARVNQLVDMGFGRHAAERALLRARNNIPAATDLLLSMPHLFPNEESATPAAEAANEPTASDAEVATEPAASVATAGAQTESAQVAETPATPPAASGSATAAGPSSADDSASAPTNETNEAAMDVDPVPSPNTVWESLRAELAKLRDPCKDQLATRAMELLDQAEELVFDLLPAFPSGVDGAEFIIGHIDQVIKESPRRDAAISSRLRLLAVFARSSQLIELSAKQSKDAIKILMSLNVTMDPRPKWLAAYFLAIESVLLMTYTMESTTIVTDKNDPIPAPKDLIKTVDFGSMPDTLIKTAVETLQGKDLTRQETMSALRIIVILTRHHPQRCSPVVINTVFTAFKSEGPNLSGCHPLIAMIARHAFDEKADLRDIMRREIREWMNPERNKVVDISHFVRQLRQAAYRDADTFVEAVQEECELVSSDPPTNIYHVRNVHSRLKNDDEGKAKEDKKDAGKDEGDAAHLVSADPFKSSGVDTFTTNPTMDFLVSELGSVMRTIQKDEAAFRAGTPFPEETSKAYTYAGLILSVITELVGSYFSAKRAFMAALRHGSLYGGGKGKSGFAVIVNDMTCCITLADVQEKVRGTNGTNELRRLALSNWASCLIIALCANITPTYDIKDLPDDLVVVRKVVLEGIAKALKDSSTATPDPSARYGRLYALGELIYGLLTTTLSVVPRPGDDSRLHLAKTMLEKNFVSLMTSAVSEIDLNYPDIRNVLVALLRALEHLTKISIKWGRTNKPTGQTEEVDEDESVVSEEDSDISMSEEEEDEAPDLYRNSALGILGGDIDIEDEDDDMDDDDMDDEDDLLEAFGDEMDHDMVDDDDGTEPSSDEEDDEGADDEDDGMEGEWETEDENEDEEDEHPDINIDDAFDDLGEPPVPWDEDGMMEGEEMGDEEFSTEDDDEDEAEFLDNEFNLPFDLDDDNEALDYYDDGELYDEDDPLRIAPGVLPGSSGDRGSTGYWGWQEPSTQSGDPTRGSLLRDDPATSLFGLPPRTQNDNNQHPLLSGAGTPNIPGRSNANPFGALTSLNDLMNSVEVLGGSEAVHFLEQIVQQRRHSGADRIRVDLAQHQDGSFGLTIGGRELRVNPRSIASVPVTPERLQAEFKPRPTMPRWLDEQAIFPYVANEQVTQVANNIVNRLLPDARVRDKAEAEKKAQAEEARKKKEQEEAEAAAALAAEAEPEPAPPSDAGVQDDDVEMATDDEEGSNVSDAEDEAAVEPTGPRVTIMIHGEEVDITDTGIDLEFLEALPEDMRAEVVEGQLREQNRLAQPAATDAPASSSQINPEFLSALPPELRAEVIMQETLDQARRQQDEPQEAVAPAGRGNAVDAMNDLATELVDEINDLMPDSRGLMEILRNPPGRLLSNPLGVTSRVNTQPRPKRDAIQLLEKPGIASLVRLLFFPEAIRKTYLYRILGHLCENTKTRVDLLNLLLSIVQDGSGDLLAVDRSFQQMSLKAMSTPKATTTPKGKTLDTPAPAPVVNSLFTHLQSDHIPTFIAQRCFDALNYIVTANQQAVTYFLTEHEQPVGLRKLPSKKGKGKEKYLPQTKFPIVILIGLFDRPALLKTPGMMESLTGVLAMITKPLANLHKEPEDKPPAPESTLAVSAPNAAVAGNTTTPAVGASATSTAGAPTSTTSGEPAATKEPPNSSTTLKAPLIPPSVLRLVVNGLTIGDCTSRTFSQTITILQNLSCIPDAKAILVQELCTRAQQLGTVIQGELKELASCLEVKDVEISPTAIAKFSPASSSQAQLLRILKTIDFLHSRKADSEMNKDRLLTKDEEAAGDIYRSFDFTNMWKQLGDCLTLAEERESTEQIAAVLLPLVEALMVVCKYTHAASQLDPTKSPLLSPTTPPPTDLFFAFTTTHRKVLNAIVRNNPSLMNGSFSLLIANPRVLEFDNKRNWFFLKLKRKREAVPYGSLHLNVRRQYVFQDSYSALLHRPGDEVKYGRINVKFINEDGIDAGGVTREWYHVLAQQIFDPNFALFEPCAADQQTYQPNKHSSVVDDHLSFFRFVGRVIGKAIFDGRLLDAYFSRAFYKQILGRSVDMRDLESVDPEFHKSLQWMLDNDITDIIDQEFTIEDDSFGEKKVVELKPGGAKISVTEDNKAEYVRLVCAYRLENSIKEQMNSFLTGFYEIIPRHLIQIFEPDQLELLISGMSQIDVDELKNATQLTGLKSSDTDVAWFWRALRSFSQEERARFLMFVTSSSRVPLGGFSQLQGSSGTQPFQIQRLYGKEGILPQASTCFNLLLLPKYSSYEQLRERLLFAVTETSGFGKA